LIAAYFTEVSADLTVFFSFANSNF